MASVFAALMNARSWIALLHIADAHFDPRFDLGVLFHPCLDLFVATVASVGSMKQARRFSP
jgi:hypothetical protein